MSTTPNPTIVFLSCGGTIEKIYLPDSGKLSFDHSRMSEWAGLCRIAQPWRAETVMLIDSLEMTEADREQVARRVAETPESHVVILHGTDTMVQTANRVAHRRQNHQTVVFTGAMIPISQPDSDGLFNLGLATAAVQLLDPGVYIAMSGQIFAADQVQKNSEKGVFESLSPDQESREHPDENGTLRITKRKMTGFFR